MALLTMLQKKLEQSSADQAILLTRMCGHYLNLTSIAEQHYMYAPSLLFHHIRSEAQSLNLTNFTTGCSSITQIYAALGTT